MSPELPIQFRLAPRSFASLAKEFATAQTNVTKLKEDPGNSEKLKLYAMFKQATAGKNTSAKPGMLDFVKRAKWDAWSAPGDMSKVAIVSIESPLLQDDAMKEYVTAVDPLIKEKGISTGIEAKAADESPKASSTSSDTWILRKIEGKIFHIQLNRPDKKNALTPAVSDGTTLFTRLQMYDRIADLLAESGKCMETSITVISAVGDMYCSGNDLSNITSIISDPQKMAKESNALLQ